MLSVFVAAQSAHASFDNVSVTVTGTPNPAGQNVLVTLAAQILDIPHPGTVVNQGTVTFKDGGTAISGAIAVSNGAVSFQTSSLAVGTHSIVAAFNGNGGSFGTTQSSAYTLTITAAATPGTPSQNAATTQTAITRNVSTISNQVVASGIGGAIAGGFSGAQGSSPVSVQASAGGMRFFLRPVSEVASNDGLLAANDAGPGGTPGITNPADVNARKPVLADNAAPWTAWLDVRDSGWTRNGDAIAGDLSGSQLNITGGVSRKLCNDLLVGLVLGYEHASFDATLLSSNLSDNGAIVGPYVGWRIMENLLLDAAVTYGNLNFTSNVSGATGTFGAQRAVGSLGLTGGIPVGMFVIAPSVRASVLAEKQNDWTDSAGSAQAAQNFNGGLASVGAKAIYTIDLSPATRLRPYVGLFSDSLWASTGLQDSWMGTAVAGADAAHSSGWAFGLGGQYRGLGVLYKQWAVNATVSTPF